MTSSSCLDERCVDSEKNPDLIDPADGLEGGNITELYVGNVTYTCGSTLTLEDIYLIYTPSGSQSCADIGCENGLLNGDSSDQCFDSACLVPEEDQENCRYGINLIEQAADAGHGGALYYLALLVSFFSFVYAGTDV